MALADIPSGGPPRRLDSWKEIAEYLRRDVRTATRWESQGLPLHRVAGGKGRSVFAFTNEIDAWMASHPAEPEADVVVIEPASAALVPDASPHRLRTIAITAACAIVLVGIGAVVMSSGAWTPIYKLQPEITVTGNGVSITDASGVSRVIHPFKPGAVLGDIGLDSQLVDLNSDGAPEVLARVDWYRTDVRHVIGSGELLNLSTEGAVHWRFVFDDVMTFAGGPVSGPWVMTDWQVEPDTSPKRIAIAARDHRAWPSVVAMLDHAGQRLGSFVNPGWIESVRWRSSSRLLIAGFNNLQDEGMFAMLNAGEVSGQAPGSAGTDYLCRACPSTPPLFYATFPRSEVNRATASRFNRARVFTAGDRIVVDTIEMARQDNGAVTAMYEFDRDLRLLTAKYSDTYWDEHLRLELEGRLNHTREKCPERDGPAAINVWDAARGWIRATPSGGS